MSDKASTLRIKELEAALRVIRIWVAIEANTGCSYGQDITHLCDTVLGNEQ